MGDCVLPMQWPKRWVWDFDMYAPIFEVSLPAQRAHLIQNAPSLCTRGFTVELVEILFGSGLQERKDVA
eukprot:15101-Amphidinium_carterae.1